MTRQLPSPQFAWADARTAFSERFGDVYRSRDGALEETRHVFLDGCGLPDAWRGAAHFTIAETGFGTGLNFLATLAAWRRSPAPRPRLHYIAVEGFPLSPAQIAQAADQWPDLGAEAAALKRAYQEPQAGYRRVFLDDGAVTLTLLFGEVAEMLADLEASVDAWFLDGFAPDRNPEMWRGEVMQELARLSRTGTRLATYTIAGAVRRGLEAVGFAVSRHPGVGRKRDVLRAVFAGGPHTGRLAPWFARPAPAPRGHAAIIGAGLAGAYAASALQRRGWTCTVIEQEDHLAPGASGNGVGVLMPRLTAGASIDGQFYAAAWRFTLDALDRLAASHDLGWDRCGVLQLGERDKLEAIAALGGLPESYARCVDATAASAMAGVEVARPALHMPHGGWLRPGAVCAALMGGMRLIMQRRVAGVVGADGGWRLIDDRGQAIAQSDIVVFANAMHAGAFGELAGLPLAARRGQITALRPTAASGALRAVISYGGYITPVHAGQHCVGATFDWARAPLERQETRAEDHLRNVGALDEHLPALGHRGLGDVVGGRASVRCTTPDHLPIAGPVPAWGEYAADFAELRHGHPWTRYPDARYQPGLYVLTGLGSRGLVAAPLAAELLACQVSGEPWPLPRAVAEGLHPGRFLIRDLKRGQV